VSTPPADVERAAVGLAGAGAVWRLSIDDSGAWPRPWRGTMTHGVFHVGEAGGGTWRSRTRRGLVRKMLRSVASMAAAAGDTSIVVEVLDERAHSASYGVRP
jgi:hypothetical protein